MNNHIKNYLKLPYKKIDNVIINSLIIDLFDNGYNYTDLEIKQILKAFCYNRISDYYHDFNVEIVSKEEIDSKSKLEDVEGLVLGRTIYLEENIALDIRNSNVEILRIILHEAQHIKQRYLLEINEINYRSFLLIMEQIIIMEMSELYYKDNYIYLFEEIDARLEAEFQLFDFLDEYNSKILCENIDDILDNISSCEQYAENIYRLSNNKRINREELFDKIIRKNPKYIEVYPLLNFYYNTDGSKIPIARLIERKNSIPKNKCDETIYNKVKKLDTLIIKNRSGSKLNIKRDIQSLINYIPSDDIQFNIMEQSLNELLTIINNSYEENIINDIYDSLIDRVDYFKNKINETKNSANMYTIKLYLMLQNASYRKK